ncbi:DUF6624 domain-containing protein [Hymenobacter sp. APR13]|uniref:DUF6624 domain-containing protein n=1 Tax=Hymenobacter sp. APR13 TaxID=1356852 RepID=UPI0012E082BE|nr:DUF6624 domain-containing protein [Hymenobacter sp. APR13]
MASPVLAATLDSLSAADWQDRQVIFAVFRQHGFASTAADTANRWLLRQDAARLAALQQLERRHGWPAVTQAGAEAARTAFLLLQHAPDSVQVRYLARVAALYKAKRLPPSDYATYLDRALLNQGQRQQYGTQSARVVRPSGETVDSLLPTAEFFGLDKRRRAMKLEPLQQLRPGTMYFKTKP